MRKWRQPGDDRSDTGSGGVRNRAGAAADPDAGSKASFDAAQDLLAAAIAEIRGTPTGLDDDTDDTDAEWRPPAWRPGATLVGRPRPTAQPDGSADDAPTRTFWSQPDDPDQGATPGAVEETTGTTESTAATGSAGSAGSAGTEESEAWAATADEARPDHRRRRRRAPVDGDPGDHRRRRRAPSLGDELPPATPRITGSTGTVEPVEITEITETTEAAEQPETTGAAAPSGTPGATDADDDADADADAGAVVGADTGAATDDDLADLEFVPAAWATQTPAGAASDRSRRRRVLVGVVAGVVAVAAVVALLVLPGGSNDAAVPTPTKAARLTFDPVTTPGGAQVTRTWELRGDKGIRFTGSLIVSNPNATAQSVTWTETIPKAIAPSVRDLTFSPQPVVVQADPVVRWVVSVPPRSGVTLTYSATVAPDGATRGRLEAWALQVPATTPTTTTPKVEPTTPPTTVPATPVRPTPTVAPTPTPTPTVPPTPQPTVPPQDGAIVLRVVSRGGTGAFSFGGTAGFVLDTTPGGSAEWSAAVAPGLYPFTQESMPPGFRLRDIDCSDRDAGPFEQRSIVNPPTVTFNVQPGETVVCTFYDDKG